MHRGADDNASGVAAALATAKRLAASPGDRGVVVAFWSGEELGLLGSTDFVRKPVVAPESLAACLNFDMVGRAARQQAGGAGRGLEPGLAGTGGAGQRAGRASIFSSRTIRSCRPIRASFDRAGVPCLNFFTGGHEDYHRPSDTPEKLNYEDMERVVDLAANVGRRLIAAPEPIEFTKVEPKVERGPAPDAVRAFTGTIPDYTAEVEGLKLARRHRRRPRRAGGSGGRRRDRPVRRAQDREHLRLHLCARSGEDRRAPQGRLPARRGAPRDHGDAASAALTDQTRVCR